MLLCKKINKFSDSVFKARAMGLDRWCAGKNGHASLLENEIKMFKCLAISAFFPLVKGTKGVFFFPPNFVLPQNRQKGCAPQHILFADF